MKDSYKVLENGKVKVNDYDVYGNLTEYEYNFQDNIEQLLEEENIKEYLEQEKKELEKEIFDNESAMKRNKEINLTLGMAIILITILFGIIPYNLQVNNSLFLAIVSVFTALTVTTPLILFSIRCNKKFSNIVNACKVEIEEINKLLNKTNDNINKLQNNKYNTREQEMKKIPGYIKVNSIEQLKNLKNYLFNFYSLGHQEKELSEYYQQGILDEILEEKYEEEETAIIKKYFQEKGPMLVKRKK